MPKPFQRRMKRIHKKVSKETKLVFKDKKKSNPSCSLCKKTLFGLKVKGKVKRKFGGALCSKCSRRGIIESARKKILGK